ncbi:hypothetical protein DBR36_11880 [Microbacterium sp. HMWF026]|uniref:hypothetical protein n=1 Tax=Microbacterium sp. HMWF026 TaxID=2056861 RepID=UPI000D386136|nr:hypothetical protein [Microbacterium sp. HMWF026]PTT16931.1 hypothetical protein DBR36_11880 [Microbacterium sp. HMWF026]
MIDTDPESSSLSTGRWATVGSRFDERDALLTFIERTVSVPLTAMDAAVVLVCAALGVTATVAAAPLLQWFALAGVAIYAALRLVAARREADAYVGLSTEPSLPVAAAERDILPVELTAPCDARTLAELDAVVRGLHPAVRLRIRPWLGFGFWVLALGMVIASVLAASSARTTVFASALLATAAASFVPVAVWAVFGWANQRHIDAMFREVDEVIEKSALPIGDLPGDAALRVGDDGRAVVRPERLTRGLRPRRRTAVRPSVVPMIVITTLVMLATCWQVVVSGL